MGVSLDRVRKTFTGWPVLPPWRLPSVAFGQALGVVMVVIYLGRLIILDPTNPVVRVALALGVIANAVFFVQLGRHRLRR